MFGAGGGVAREEEAAPGVAVEEVDAGVEFEGAALVRGGVSPK